jgi:TRAP-type transport system periplasmic protein
MTTADVLPARQQGTIDGALASVPVISTLHLQNAARYITETDQSYVMTVVLVSKKWLDRLPAHLQAITRAAATQVNNEIRPSAFDFLLEQRNAWIGKGGVLIALSPAQPLRSTLSAQLLLLGVIACESSSAALPEARRPQFSQLQRSARTTGWLLPAARRINDARAHEISGEHHQSAARSPRLTEALATVSCREAA